MNAAMVVLNLRLSRLALAVVAGAMLSIAGAIMRATTRNGLANPVMLGVRESASLAVLGCGHRHAVLGKSALEIGCETDTSDSTVIRAIQALGFQGLVDLKETLEVYLGVTDSPVEKMATKTKSISGNSDAAIDFVIENHKNMLEMLANAKNPEAMAAAVRLLSEARVIGVLGIGASGIIATYATRLFQRSGVRAYALNATGITLAKQLLELEKAISLSCFCTAAPTAKPRPPSPRPVASTFPSSCCSGRKTAHSKNTPPPASLPRAKVWRCTPLPWLRRKLWH